MRLFVSGPVTGVPYGNRRAFEDARTALEDIGYRVVLPHDVVRDPGCPWRDAMRRTIAAMCLCDAVVTLEGWELSKGASLEVKLARALGIPVDSCEKVVRGARAVASRRRRGAVA